ncbi:NACHT domain-containing protein [Umezawaea endophytica]|uniref:NACHT domain-containing protein n=1 Tax=Umezawaea endophytica TaxID=1654476 RepID=A0A9X2VS47_9PSEU|nr:NACHT domain-containing protein [Umezawaea endophytica]MCS7481347.1 NACHT domain-containing protein [Umezawaea endophytica]
MTWQRFIRVARTAAVVGLSAVTTLVLLPIAINVGTGGTAPGFLARFQDWLWPAVAVLTAVTVVLGTWDRLRAKSEPYLKGRWDHPSNRRAALNRIESWVGSRLDSSLGRRTGRELDLKLSPQPSMVICPVDLIEDPYVELGEPSSNHDIARLFTDNHSELLVLGDPGSGKSTVLLHLCQKLVEEAREDSTRPLPIVVDLASWSPSSQNSLRLSAQLNPLPEFEPWLLAQVVDRYKLPIGHVKKWFRAGRLVLLLDGLDEVNGDDRNSCVDKINALTEQFGNQVAVCSRIKDYQTLKEKLKLYQAVRIEPLERHVVEDYLGAVSPVLDGVRGALEDAPRLWELLDSPLMLNIMALTYRSGEAAGAPEQVGAHEEPHRRLFDAYVVEMLVRRHAPEAPFDSERVIRGLRFLALVAKNPFWNDLVARRKLMYRVAWLDFVPAQAVHRMFTRFEPAMLIGMLSAFGFAVGSRFGLVEASVVTACSALFILVLVARGRSDRVPVRPERGDRRSWHWGAAGFAAGAVGAGVAVWSARQLGLLVGSGPDFVGVGLVVLVTFAVAFANLVTFNSYTPGSLSFIASLVPAVVMIWTGPSPDLVAGLATGFAVGGLTGTVTMSFSRLWATADRAGFGSPGPRGRWVLLDLAVLLVGAGAGLGAAGLLGASFDTSVLGSLTGLAIGLLIGPVTAVQAIFPFDVTHGLAELLAKPLAHGELPWRRTVLLRFASDRILLTEVDGEYRFVHALVRDHLAACDPVRLAELVRRRVAAKPDGE